MIHLLKIEYSKLRHYSTFWVMLIIYAVMVPLAIFGFAQLERPPLLNGSDKLHFPHTWNFVTYVASIFNMLLGILVVLIVTNDFNFRTFKQNIIDGLSRGQVITAKFLIVFVLALVVALYTILMALFFGFLYSDEIVSVFENFYFVGIYFIQTLGYFTLAFLLAILLKKPALSIVIYAILFVFKFIFYFVLGAIGSQFIPMNIFADLTPFPILQEQIAMLEGPQAEGFALIISQPIRTAVAIGYIIIFIILSRVILKKRDL
ncbi:MAG: ABC transporter permease [Fluviicola sp.]|nr:ABC transporter permease [Fluviicola sp.]